MKATEQTKLKGFPAFVKLIPIVTILLLMVTTPASAQQAGSDEVAPAIISSGGEIQQGEWGEMFSTVGEPIVGDSTALDSDGGEVTWTGFWNLVPTDSTSGVVEEWTSAGAGESALTSVAPNPFNETLTLYLRIAKPATVRLTAYDMTGQEVLRLVDGTRQAGTTRLRWNPVDVAQGTYLLMLEIDGTLLPGIRVSYLP